MLLGFLECYLFPRAGVRWGTSRPASELTGVVRGGAAGVFDAEAREKL